MSRISLGEIYQLAWRIGSSPLVPGALVRGIANLAADITWARRTGGVRQLEANLARLRADLDDARVRRTSRLAMRSYLRYYAEAFRMPGFTPEEIDARVRGVGAERLQADIASGRSVALALGHCGNWDLAGAWAARHIAPVLTVAEKLPDGQFEQFVAFRESLGIEIIALEGSATFRTLLRRAKGRQLVIPLLADRDLTAHGIPVDLAGSPARVAAGPAALALSTKIQLYATIIYYERLTGQRRRQAKSPWGIVLEFVPVPMVTGDGEATSVPELTQAWVTELFTAMARTPQDWHMLQKVFLADLDPERLARAAERAAGAEG